MTKTPVEPDQILWNNLKFGTSRSWKRKILMFLVAIFMSQASLFSKISIFRVTNKFEKLPDCDPLVVVDIGEAYRDQKKA